METEGHFRANQIRGRRTKKEKLCHPKTCTAPMSNGWLADICVWVIKFCNFFERVNGKKSLEA
jgi:hypothetical protein